MRKYWIYKLNVLLALSLLVFSCEDQGVEKLTGPAPGDNTIDVSDRVTGFENNTTGAGALVVAQGNNLQDVNFVLIDNRLAEIVEVTSNNVSFLVPEAPAPSLGMVDVVFIFSGDERAFKEIEVVPNPTISIIYPLTASTGDEITIRGGNLDAVEEVGIGDVAGTIVSASAGQLVFTVPEGAPNNEAFYLVSSAGSTVVAEQEFTTCESAGDVIQCLPSLNVNGGFEIGEGTDLMNWNVFNSGNPSGDATITVGTEPSEFLTGSRAMKVINPTAYPGSQWRVQVASDAFPTEAGKTYLVSYMVKAESDGGSIRLSTAPNASYQGDQTIGTSWQEVTWSFTVTVPEQVTSQLVFDMGQAANTYYIDNVKVVEEQ